MQYVLTKEEYDALNERPTLAVEQQLRSTVEKLATELLRARGYQCIHDYPSGQYHGHCDDCPLSGYWSKKTKTDSQFLNYDESKIACTKARDYSK